MPNPGGLNAGYPVLDPSSQRGPDNYSFVQSPRFPGLLSTGLLVAQHTAAGIMPVFQKAAGGGDRYANTGRETLLVLNTSGSAVVVTIKAQSVCNVGPGFLHDIVTTVLNGASGPATIGPAAFQFFNDANNQAWVVYSTVVGVTVALIVS